MGCESRARDLECGLVSSFQAASVFLAWQCNSKIQSLDSICHVDIVSVKLAIAWLLGGLLGADIVFNFNSVVQSIGLIKSHLFTESPRGLLEVGCQGRGHCVCAIIVQHGFQSIVAQLGIERVIC